MFNPDIILALYRGGAADAAALSTIDEIGAAELAGILAPTHFRVITGADALVPSTDERLLFDPTAANFTFTLTTPGSGKRTVFRGKNVATNGNAVTLQPDSGLIDGEANLVVSGSNQPFDFEWNGSNWYTF